MFLWCLYSSDHVIRDLWTCSGSWYCMSTPVWGGTDSEKWLGASSVHIEGKIAGIIVGLNSLIHSIRDLLNSPPVVPLIVLFYFSSGLKSISFNEMISTVESRLEFCIHRDILNLSCYCIVNVSFLTEWESVCFLHSLISFSSIYHMTLTVTVGSVIYSRH